MWTCSEAKTEVVTSMAFRPVLATEFLLIHQYTKDTEVSALFWRVGWRRYFKLSLLGAISFF